MENGSRTKHTEVLVETPFGIQIHSSFLNSEAYICSMRVFLDEIFGWVWQGHGKEQLPRWQHWWRFEISFEFISESTPVPA